VNAAIIEDSLGYSAVSTARQLVGYPHQIAQVGHRMFGDRGFDQAERLEPAAGLERRRHILRGKAQHLAEHGIGLLRAGRLAVDQYRTQVALIFAQRGMQQHGLLGIAQPEHRAQHRDVVQQPDARLGQPLVEDSEGRLEHRQQILAVQLHVFVDEVVEGAVVVQPVPGAMADHELVERELSAVRPGRRIGAAARQEIAQPGKDGFGPETIAGRQCDHIVDVAAQVESRTQREDRAQRETGAGEIHRAGRFERRRHVERAPGSGAAWSRNAARA
jgi:hypothetical protein